MCHCLRRDVVRACGDEKGENPEDPRRPYALHEKTEKTNLHKYRRAGNAKVLIVR
jgi:hypothetical protein